MRVAFVTAYPPSRSGIGDYAAKLVAALRGPTRSDTEIDVYSLARDGITEEGQRAILSMNPGSWWRLRKELSAGRYDVVHVQFDLSTYLFLTGPLFFILAAIRLAGRPRLVATYHEAYADRKLYGWFSIVFYHVFSRLFHRVYVHSHLAEECLITQYRVPCGKVRRIDHGTFEFADHDLNHQELRSRWRLDESPVVLCFGYIYKRKGIEVLIDAVRTLASSGRPLPTVIIAGEPPERHGIFRFFQVRNRRYLEELKLRVHDSGLEDTVIFVGYVEDAELYSLFTLAQVVVLPYLAVDQSGVLNIAIAAQTPVIASDIGGLGETLADVGIVVAPGSSTELARALDELLASPDIRMNLRTAYRGMAERLNTDNVAVTMVEDYRALCEPRPRRIIQVSAYYPPHLGGQEFVVEQLSQALARVGTDVTVVCSRLPNRISYPDKIAVKRLWAREVAHTPLMPGLPMALLRQARGALFHLHTGQAFVPEIVGLVSGLFRRPYLSHVHLIVRPSGRLGYLLPVYQRLVLGVVLRRSAAVICLTEDMRRQVIRNFGVRSDRAVVIANGVDEDWFVSSQRAAKPGEILFVGRLAAQKNLSVVIRAMAELPDARLTVIGDGEDRSALEDLVNELELHNVNFVGRREPAEVRAAMLNASLLVLPSTYEGMPLVLLQAGAAGLPVVASDIPELREAGLAGRLVGPDEPADWVAALRELLTNDSLLNAMSDDAVSRARSRRWECLVTEWTELYSQVFAAHRRN